MSFESLIKKYEGIASNNCYIEKLGELPVILTAPHTMRQIRKDGTIKLDEPFTKAIALYISNKLNCFSLVKVNDTGIDSNSLKKDNFKKRLIKLIKKYNIKLVLDIHGAKEEREFDVELGTLNNLSADFSSIKELSEAFTENGIKNVSLNTPFKGGGITQIVFGKTECDVIQIEINKKYRDINRVENIEKICNAIIKYIEQYSKYLD